MKAAWRTKRIRVRTLSLNLKHRSAMRDMKTVVNAATRVVTIMSPLTVFWSMLRAGLVSVTVNSVTPQMNGIELRACRVMINSIRGFLQISHMPSFN